MTDRTVAVDLVARTAGYSAEMLKAAAATNAQADAMTKAAAAQKTFDKSQATVSAGATKASKAQLAQAAASEKQLKAMTTLGKGLLTFGVVSGVAFGAAVKAATDFQKQMALVGTLAKATPGDLAKLSDAALHAGQAYGYTATQVADAEAELVKAGISVNDILGGALQGTLTLAAAGQIDVAQATEIAASAMTQFALAGKDVPHIADLLASGADKALGSVGDLGLALSQVGTTAHQFGFTLDDTVAVLAEFAQQGQIGQKAGTELNQAFLQLAAPTQQAQGLMDKYGFSVYTAAGHFKSFADIANSLQISFGKLTEQQRNQALATIFGSRAIRAANILYQDGAAGVLSWENKIKDSGFAVEQATGKLNSLSGDLQKLKAAFQTGLIEEGSGVQNTLRGIVQGLTSVVEWFDKLSPAAQSMILEVTGVASVFALAGGAALVAIPKIVAFQAALATLRGTAVSTADALTAEAGAETLAGNAAKGGASTGLLARLLGGGAAAEGGGLLAGAGASVALPVATAASVALLLQYQHKEEGDRRTQQINKLAADPKALAAARANLAKLKAQQKAASGGGGPISAVFNPSTSLKSGAQDPLKLSQDIVSQQSLIDAASKAAKNLTTDNYALDKGASAAQIALNNEDRAAAKASLTLFAAGENANSTASAMILLGKGADAASDDVKALAKAIQTDMDNAAKAFAKDLDPIGNFTGGNLTKQFNKAISAGQTFNTRLAKVAAKGLNPDTLQRLIAEGPAAAGPLLQKLVGKNSAALIKMTNDQQAALDRIQAQTVENARLTSLAEHANTDAMTRDLGDAMKISAAKAKHGGTETAAALADSLHIGLAKVYNIAAEYGIGLESGIQAGTDASTRHINALKGNLATLNAVRANPKVSLAGKAQVDADIAAIQSEIARLTRLHVINIQANAKITLAISGQGNSGATHSAGGSTVPQGRPGRDTVGPYMLDSGEEIIRADRARKFRPLLKAINNAPGLAAGGTAGSRQFQAGLNQVVSHLMPSWQSAGSGSSEPLHIHVEDRSGRPVQAGEQAALGYQRYATVARGRW